MKHFYFFILLIASAKLSAQTPIEVNWFSMTYPSQLGFDFDATGGDNYIAVDAQQTGNLWQIGHVQKTTFTSTGRALVTDTLNSYPAGNTSSFTIKIINYQAYMCTIVGFSYSVQSSAGLDGGTIELSHNNGASWVNLVADNTVINNINCGMGNLPYTINDTVAALGKPGVSGNVGNGMSYITIMPQMMTLNNDTILMRFTFASDSSAESSDGWMLDDFTVEALGEGVVEHSTALALDLHPNPTNGKIFLHSSAVDQFDVEVHDCFGRLVMREKAATSLDLSALPNGCYFLQAENGDQIARRKLIVQH
jgi:hypothetical protein